ncbi:conserved hypothetical protein [Leishmania mexicana MHOM/GT/2001/U1103]|uniref:Uncharacterized protein n=1 Tax=Leishmania mexicana (strain MHOM/GT/2001/U1103) TaxID=929439 RepID=E9AMK3_LEIMU|nr:conserved hypothetical protein [Leishmania mexicana MHOM/GT/2001/U1103]CBZ24158.1 conserved hypothetical protein [Leishmania mexicana MHOM/GT/2001/U1103]
MDAKEFVQRFPKSALSAKLVLSLESTEQRDCVVSLIDDAVYCDSWEAYFDFAERNNVAITEDVALAAVQAVGLDPLSAPLWVRAAACCESVESRKSLYEFGLSVPLHGWQRLFEEYRRCTNGHEDDHALSETECWCVSNVLTAEKWPDRYAKLDTDAEAEEVRQAWLELFSCMLTGLAATVIARDLQLRRIELAMRQMCSQLPGDDSCWYQLALFQLRILEDAEAARRTVASGIAAAGPSFALENIASVVDGVVGVSDSSSTSSADALSATKALMQQRRAAEELASDGVTKDRVRALRSVGKAAAQQGLGDWKVFSQWRCAEDMAVHDTKMAAKVLENGMICCSHSPTDALLLGSEAAQYHLLQRHEREALGYAEQQIEQQAGLHHRGKIMASWNSLVRIESLLGLSFSKAAKRRAELFPQNRISTFMENCRVGDYLPCDKSTFQWVRFVEDYQVDKASVEETPFHGIAPPRNKAVAVKRGQQVECETPDDSQWEPFVPPPSCLPSREEENPDDVTGVRELRGKLVYRVKVDSRTAARCQREKATRQRSKTGEKAIERGGALGALMRRVCSVNLTAGQTKRLQSVSADWVVHVLTVSELDLERTLKERAERQESHDMSV